MVDIPHVLFLLTSQMSKRKTGLRGGGCPVQGHILARLRLRARSVTAKAMCSWLHREIYQAESSKHPGTNPRKPGQDLGHVYEHHVPAQPGPRSWLISLLLVAAPHPPRLTANTRRRTKASLLDHLPLACESCATRACCHAQQNPQGLHTLGLHKCDERGMVGRGRQAWMASQHSPQAHPTGARPGRGQSPRALPPRASSCSSRGGAGGVSDLCSSRPRLPTVGVQ